MRSVFTTIYYHSRDLAVAATMVLALVTVVEALGTTTVEASVMLVLVTPVVVVDLEIAVVLAAAMEVALGEALDTVDEVVTENHPVGVGVLVVDLESLVVVLGLQMALLMMIRTANHLDLVVVLDDPQEVLVHPVVPWMRVTTVSHPGLEVGLVMVHQQMGLDLVVGLVVVMKIQLEVEVLVDVQEEMIHVEFVNKVAILQEIAQINHQETTHAAIVVKVVILREIVLVNQKRILADLHL